jgi:hypothetical protein
MSMHLDFDTTLIDINSEYVACLMTKNFRAFFFHVIKRLVRKS